MRNLAILLLFMLYGISPAIANPICQDTSLQLVESVPVEAVDPAPNLPKTEQFWICLVSQAKKSIDIGAYYFSGTAHSAMGKVFAALEQAAKRGVHIRIVIDSTKAKHDAIALDKLSKTKNVQIRYLPLTAITGGILHAKYMIIDNNQVFVGSQNFDWRALNQNYELGIYIRNSQLAKTIARIFQFDWKLAHNPSHSTANMLQMNDWDFAPVTAESPIIIRDGADNIIIHPAFSSKQLNPIGVDWSQTEFIKLIEQAQHQIVMQVMTFSPLRYGNEKVFSPAIYNAVITAAARGVKIQLMVANWGLGKPDIYYLKILSLLPNVSVKYIAVPEDKRGFIPFARVSHSKYFVVDNHLIWLGTGNWRWNYFNSGRNISLIINSKNIANQLKQLFQNLWHSKYAHLIVSDAKYSPPTITN